MMICESVVIYVLWGIFYLMIVFGLVGESAGEKRTVTWVQAILWPILVTSALWNALMKYLYSR